MLILLDNELSQDMPRQFDKKWSQNQDSMLCHSSIYISNQLQGIQNYENEDSAGVTFSSFWSNSSAWFKTDPSLAPININCGE